MKNIFIQSGRSLRMAVVGMMLCLGATAFAKDIKTLVLTTTPPMHCESCELKIKKNLRFIKGVKEIQTDVEAQTVTIQYDAEKVSADELKKSFAKIDYTVEEIKLAAKEADKHECSCCKTKEK